MSEEDIVVSLELAKKLKEAGIEQDSLCYWIRWKDKDKWSIKCVDEYMREEWKFSPLVEYYSAYTATELIEKLPSLIREGLRYTLCIYKLHDSYIVEYERLSEDNEIELLCEFENKKFADALAEMLIWWRKREEK